MSSWETGLSRGFGSRFLNESDAEVFIYSPWCRRCNQVLLLLREKLRSLICSLVVLGGFCYWGFGLGSPGARGVLWRPQLETQSPKLQVSRLCTKKCCIDALFKVISWLRTLSVAFGGVFRCLRRLRVASRTYHKLNPRSTTCPVASRSQRIDDRKRSSDSKPEECFLSGSQGIQLG